MKEWSKLAPYNFIHAMRVASPVDPGRWSGAIDVTLKKIGLTDDAIPLEKVGDDIDAHLEAELVRPFSEADGPIRFFVTSSGHWLGATVDHWFADDLSCRLLLEQIYGSYHGNAANFSIAARRPASRTRLGGQPWRNWKQLVRQAIEMRRACRTPMRDPTDFGVKILRAASPEGALEAGRELARAHNGTLHDLFLAATAQAFGAARKWEAGTQRDRVAIASPIDLRRFDAASGPNGFGLLISHFIVSEARPHERSLGDVIQSIAGQTRRYKSDSRTDPHRPALFLWRLPSSTRAKATHYLRGAPLVAGLSNVNLTGSWIEDSNISEFRRIGPTGPIVPMVIVITTFRGRLFFDVTYRTTAFGEAEATNLVNDIIRRVADQSARRSLIADNR
jgi:hypothetical protein